MRSRLRGIVVVTTLGAVLACSGMGLCWLQFTRQRAHACCGGSDAMKAPPKPCGSEANSVASIKPAPPLQATAAPDLFSRPVELVSRDAAFAPAFPVFSPPLVLRI